jgi:RNA polymerase sigma-70 factor (ECF subfamily)
MDIKEIAKRATEGDSGAFSILYKKHKASILGRMIMATNGNTQLAEDITQDAFVKAFNNIQKFNPETSFYSWVNRIAKNTLIDHFRLNEQKNHKLSLTDSIDDEDGETILSMVINKNARPADDIIEKEERCREILNVVNKMYPKNSRQRQVLELRYFQELQYEEIAEELQIPIGTVKTDLSNIKKKLSAEFERLSFEQKY